MISIVILSTDTSTSIQDLISRCSAYSKEIIVADCCSKDTDKLKTEGIKTVLACPKGIGEAVTKSLNVITGDIIVFLTADGAHDPNDIPKLTVPIEQERAHHVSSSRLVGGSSEKHGDFNECFRLSANAFVTFCINHKFKVCLSDSQSVFRAVKTDVIKQLNLTAGNKTIIQEMIIKTLQKDFKLLEVPIHEHCRNVPYVRVPVFTAWLPYGYSLIKTLFSTKP